MLWFTLGFAVAHSVLFIWAWGSRPESAYALDVATGAQLGALLLVIPTACAWATASVANTLLPRRGFDRRLRNVWPALLVRGLGAGVLSAVIGATLVNFAAAYAGDATILGVAAVVGAAVFTAPMPRLRRGVCVHCLYSLEGLTPGAPCPECGNASQPASAGFPRSG